MTNEEIWKIIDDYSGLEYLWNFGDDEPHYFKPADIEDVELRRLFTEANAAMHKVFDYLKKDVNKHGKDED